MEFSAIQERALTIRKKYQRLEIEKKGKEWTRSQLMEGFIVDVGELMELVMAKEGVRDVDNVDEKLAHELSDCLWSVLILAHQYGVDLEGSFLQTMDALDHRIDRLLGSNG